jgi:hypothetical protein
MGCKVGSFFFFSFFVQWLWVGNNGMMLGLIINGVVTDILLPGDQGDPEQGQHHQQANHAYGKNYTDQG